MFRLMQLAPSTCRHITGVLVFIISFSASPHALAVRTLKQSTAYNLAVFMVDSTDHVSGKTGLTLTITASKDGGSFASISPTVTELSNGWYKLALTSSHTNTGGDLALYITGSGADPNHLVVQVRPNVLGDTLPADLHYIHGYAIPNDASEYVATNFGNFYYNSDAASSATVGDIEDIQSVKTKTDFLPSVTAGNSGGLFIAGTNAPTTITSGLTANITGNLSGSVGSVSGAVGSVTGNVGGNVVGSVASVSGNVGGNVVGSVGSIGSGGITTASFAAGAIDASAMNVSGSEFTAIPWNSAWDAEVESEAADALAAIHLDHWIASADPGGIVANNSLLAKLVSKSATATFSDYVNTTDSLQAISDSVAGISTGTIDVNVTQWLGEAVETPTVNGVPVVDITHLLGVPVCD